MLTPSKCVLVVYKSLVINMDDNMAKNAYARNNYAIVTLTLILTCVLPMLKIVQIVSKMA